MIIHKKQLDFYTQSTPCMNFYIHNISNKNSCDQMHRHDFYQILFLKKGKVTHFIDMDIHKMEQYSLSIVFPNQVHYLQMSDDAEFDVIMFDATIFCSEILSNELKDYNIDLQQKINHINLKNNESYFAELINMIDQIRMTSQDLNPIRKMQIKFMIKIILLKIIDVMPTINPNTLNQNDTMLYSKFRSCLDLNYKSNRKVQYYANELGISSKKLTALCYLYSGMSPLEIIHQKLSLELKRIFLTEDFSLKEIAFQFGFSSQSALNKYVYHKFNCTPLALKLIAQKRISGKLT